MLAAKHAHLIVLNKDEQTIMYVDLHERRVVKTTPVDLNPHEIVIIPDLSRSYVTNSGGNTISILDNATGDELNRIKSPEFKFPHGLAVTLDGHRVWMASTYANRVFTLDTATDRIDRVIPTFQDKTHMVTLSPNGKQAYVPNIGSNNITVFDVASETVITHLPVGHGPEGVGVHPNGRDLYVANQHDNDVWIIDTETYEVKAKRRVGTLPIRMTFTPDGHYALVPNRESNDLSVIDCTRQWEIKRIPVGIWPGGTVVDETGDYAYVANNKTNDISIICLSCLKEVGRIDAGIHPDGMAYLPARA